jgi:hypothetical protein
MKFENLNIRLLSLMFIASSVCYFVYYLLLTKNFFHCSIADIIFYARTLGITKHIFILAILPIYIAMVIFGGILLTIFLHNRLEKIFFGFKHFF